MRRILFLLAVTVAFASCSSSVNPNILTDDQRAQILAVCTTGQGVGDAFGAPYQPDGVNRVTSVNYLENGQTDTAETSINQSARDDELRSRLISYNGRPNEISIVLCSEVVDESVGELCEFEDGFTLQWTDREYSLSVRNLQTGEVLAPATTSSAVGRCPLISTFSDDEPNEARTIVPSFRDQVALLEPLVGG